MDIEFWKLFSYTLKYMKTYLIKNEQHVDKDINGFAY